MNPFADKIHLDKNFKMEVLDIKPASSQLVHRHTDCSADDDDGYDDNNNNKIIININLRKFQYNHIL